MDELVELRLRLTDAEAQLAAMADSNDALWAGAAGAIGGAVLGALIAGAAAWFLHGRQNRHAVAKFEIERLEKFSLNFNTLVRDCNETIKSVRAVKFGELSVNENPSLPQFTEMLSFGDVYDFDEEYSLKYWDVFEKFKPLSKTLVEIHDVTNMATVKSQKGENTDELLDRVKESETEFKAQLKDWMEAVGHVRSRMKVIIAEKKKNL